MIVLIIALVGALLFSYLGWWYESRFRKKIVKGIKEDIQREIGWIELNHYQEVKRKEYVMCCLHMNHEYKLKELEVMSLELKDFSAESGGVG